MQEDSTEDCNDKLLNEDNNDVDNRVNHTDMDELTLALLMNKNHYRKYVAQTNPDKLFLIIKPLMIYINIVIEY